MSTTIMVVNKGPLDVQVTIGIQPFVLPAGQFKEAVVYATQPVRVEEIDPSKSPAVPAPAVVVVDPNGTVTLPMTGHVMPHPRTDIGEGFVGYYQRTCPITGGDPAVAGALFSVSSTLPSQTGDPQVDWPINADAYANPAAYGQSAPAAPSTGNATTDESVLQPGQLDMRTFSVEDLLFYDTFSIELGGVGGPRIEERRFINGAQMGTLNDFDNPNMQAVLDIKKKVMMGEAHYDWQGYHGMLRDALAKRRGVASI